MRTSGRTCILTSSCLEVAPCSLGWPKGCRRRSLPWPHLTWQSRSSHPLSTSTVPGLVVPSWPPCLLSSRCGSPSRSTGDDIVSGYILHYVGCCCMCYWNFENSESMFQLLVASVRWPMQWLYIVNLTMEFYTEHELSMIDTNQVFS